MPLLLLIFIFIVVPIAELYVIWQVGEAIGDRPDAADPGSPTRSSARSS